MKLQDALNKLEVLMYDSPWETVTGDNFDWDHARDLEREGAPWVPVIRRNAHEPSKDYWVIGPTRIGKLVWFKKPYYSGGDYVVSQQPSLTDDVWQLTGWYLFPWCPIKAPFSVSDVLNASLWRQPSCLEQP